MSFQTPTSIVLMLGLVGVLLCVAAYVAYHRRPRLWPILAFGAAGFLLGAVPSALKSGLDLDESGFEQRSGLWMQPKVVRMRWADIKSIHMQREYAGGKQKTDVVVVHLQNGTRTSFMAYRSWRDHWREIQSFMDQRGVKLERH